MATAKQALIVEGNEDVASEFQALLGGLGYKVTVIDKAENALSTLGSRKYELVLMNVRLPGMTWRRTLTTLKAIDPTARVMMVHSSPDEDEVRQALSAGSYAVLERPLNKERVTNLLAARSDGFFVALRG